MSENRLSPKQHSKSEPKSDPTGQWGLRAAYEARARSQKDPTPQKLHPVRLGGRSIFKTANDVRSTLKLSETPKTGAAYELKFDRSTGKFAIKRDEVKKAYCLITTASLDVLFKMTEYEGCFISIDTMPANLMTPTAFKPDQPRAYLEDQRKTKAVWKDDGEGRLVDEKGRTFDDVFGRQR